MPNKVIQNSVMHWGLRCGAVLGITLLALAPVLRTTSPSAYGQLTDICILGLVAVALNLLVGFTGQISVGHSAFFGIGAYTTAVLVASHGWTPGWTYPVDMGLCFVVGVLVGIPALRLTGNYLVLVTLSLALVLPALIRKFEALTGGAHGLSGLTYEAPAWTGLETGRQGRSEWLYWVALATLALGYLLTRNLVKSRFGRAMVAVRDNTTAAAVMGVNVALTKTAAFGVSAALAGLAGCTFALRQTQVNPETTYFTIIGSIIFLVVMVIGGTGSLLGPVVGAFLFYRVDGYTRELPDKAWLPDLFSDFLRGRANLAIILSSAILITLMFVAPFGLAGGARRIGHRVIEVVPRPTSSRSRRDHVIEADAGAMAESSSGGRRHRTVTGDGA